MSLVGQTIVFRGLSGPWAASDRRRKPIVCPTFAAGFRPAMPAFLPALFLASVQQRMEAPK